LSKVCREWTSRFSHFGHRSRRVVTITMSPNCTRAFECHTSSDIYSTRLGTNTNRLPLTAIPRHSFAAVPEAKCCSRIPGPYSGSNISLPDTALPRFREQTVAPGLQVCILGATFCPQKLVCQGSGSKMLLPDPRSVFREQHFAPGNSFAAVPGAKCCSWVPALYSGSSRKQVCRVPGAKCWSRNPGLYSGSKILLPETGLPGFREQSVVHFSLFTLA
jgi:hypothetical protein